MDDFWSHDSFWTVTLNVFTSDAKLSCHSLLNRKDEAATHRSRSSEYGLKIKKKQHPKSWMLSHAVSWLCFVLRTLLKERGNRVNLPIHITHMPDCDIVRKYFFYTWCKTLRWSHIWSSVGLNSTISVFVRPCENLQVPHEDLYMQE